MINWQVNFLIDYWAHIKRVIKDYRATGRLNLIVWVFVTRILLLLLKEYVIELTNKKAYFETADPMCGRVSGPHFCEISIKKKALVLCIVEINCIYLLFRQSNRN